MISGPKRRLRELRSIGEKSEAGPGADPVDEDNKDPVDAATDPVDEDNEDPVDVDEDLADDRVLIPG